MMRGGQRYSLVLGTAVVTAGFVAHEVLGDSLLDPHDIPKYVEPLVIPPAMQPIGGQRATPAATGPLVRYRIAARQFEQQVLPTQGYQGDSQMPFPMTMVWGYGRDGDPLPGTGGPSSFNYPAFTIETRRDQRVEVTWFNRLVNGPPGPAMFLPHLLPVDQTLHWANPPGPRDSEGDSPEPYDGPVPLITHVHGAHVPSVSDGHPEAWYLPHAMNIPRHYYRQGTHYGSVRGAPPGAAVFEYPNDQRASTLWYHDHALGITRLNVYAGLAGVWIIRDDIEDGLNLPGPAPHVNDPPGTRYYEIPLAIQDRSFHEDGSLFYPATRAFFDGDEFDGPYFPQTDVPPIWNPEFFGNTMVVNGRTWPYLEVEPRLYRFRVLNGCNSRFLVLQFDTELSFHQIGNEGGLLPGQPIVLDQLLMAPAERADVIVDFSDFDVGDAVTLINVGPDAPFGGLPIAPDELADPDTTGQVMRFVVVPPTGQGNMGEIPASLPSIDALGPPDVVRDLTLHEEESAFAAIPIAALLGTNEDGPLDWDDETTEEPIVDDTEVWQLINLTEDSHPIHLHLVQFQVLDRQEIDTEAYRMAQQQWLDGDADNPPVLEDFLIGQPMDPQPWEAGWKDTVIANPDEVTRIIALFDLPGLYVWHCHILEHEDNEMMRNYRVLTPAEAMVKNALRAIE